MFRALCWGALALPRRSPEASSVVLAGRCPIVQMETLSLRAAQGLAQAAGGGGGGGIYTDAWASVGG